MDASRRTLLFALPGLAAAFAAVDSAAADDQPLASFATPFDQLPAKKNGANTSRGILNGTTASGCILEVHETTLGPGNSPHPPHHHKHDEMLLISKGSLEVTIAGKTTVIGPGSAAYMHSGEEHGTRNPGTDETQYFVVAIGSDT